jgi:uncharacterized membrane protein YgcG
MRFAAVIPALLMAATSAWAQSPRTGSTGSGSSTTIGAAVQPGSRPSPRSAFIVRLEGTAAPAFKDELTVRAALDRLAATADVEITGLWSGRFEPGLDPERTVRIDLRPRASCMEALERLLHEIDSGGDPILWQTTRFGLEVGPRAALWRPRAIETRTYEVKDLLLRVPAFRSTGVPQAGGMGGGQGGGQGGGMGGGQGGGGQGGGAGGGGAAGGNTEDTAAGERRQLRTEELIELIQRTVEPEAWQAMGGPCSIAARDGVLIIRAPDFVHRRIEDPVAPPPRKPRKPANGDGK